MNLFFLSLLLFIEGSLSTSSLLKERNIKEDVQEKESLNKNVEQTTISNKCEKKSFVDPKSKTFEEEIGRQVRTASFYKKTLNVFKDICAFIALFFLRESGLFFIGTFSILFISLCLLFIYIFFRVRINRRKTN